MSAPTGLFVAGRAAAAALDIHFEDRRVMDESVDGGYGFGMCQRIKSTATLHALAC
ncbi:protein of unknown function [Paraburkholderia kururiensis]